MTETIKKAPIYMMVPADLKRDAEEALKDSDYRSLTHWFEVEMRKFIAKQEKKAEVGANG